MGLAYLSKSYLALITFGIAFVIWLSAKLKLLNLESGRIRLRDIGLQLLAAILTVAPWAAYCLIRYPKEYIWEHKRVLDTSIRTLKVGGRHGIDRCSTT